jgi:hypothetical protein
LGNYEKEENVENLKTRGMVLEGRDGGWMMVEMEKDKVEYGFRKWQQVYWKLKLGDDDNTYIRWFKLNEVIVFDNISGKCWILTIYGLHHIYH